MAGQGTGGEITLNARPVAKIALEQQRVVRNAIVRLDGRGSTDADEDPLQYEWSFTSVPIGSGITDADFLPMDDVGATVTYSPDVTGSYEIQLVVSDGKERSLPAKTVIEVVRTLSPYNQGIIPDVSYLWRFLPDVYNLIPDKKKLEQIWLGVFQAVAGDLLSAYQYDYNKSIATIQDTRHRKWLSYEPKIFLRPDLTYFVLSEDQAGTDGTSEDWSEEFFCPKEEQEGFVGLLRVPLASGRFDQSPNGQALRPGKLLVVEGSAYPLLGSATSRASLTYSASDGSVVSGEKRLHGSGFLAGHVGAEAVIELNGRLVRAKVASLVSPTVVELDLTESFSESATGLRYSIVSSGATRAMAYLPSGSLPAGSSPLSWRLSSTFVSQEYDLEAMGVGAGDLLEWEVLREDTGASAFVRCLITGVSEKTCSFVFGDTVKDGVPSRALSKSAQLSLASGLSISGLVEDLNGELLYSDEAEELRQALLDLGFRRRFFEQELGSNSLLDLGLFRVRLRPIAIHRTRKIAVDERILSVPALREFVYPAALSKGASGTLLITPSGETVPIDHAPVTLYENKDYVLDDEASVQGIVELSKGSALVRFPRGRLLDRSVQEGDRFTANLDTRPFTITKVLNQEEALVAPLPSASGTAAFSLRRKTAGKFLRFLPGHFSAASPPPERLWAEVTYFDNTDLVEDNFGSLVGLLREELARRGASIPYLSAVKGLLYYLSSGRSVHDTRFVAQVLFGLPFSRSEGVITQLDPVYRRRPDGSPEYGRIVVSETSAGEETGRSYVYLFPHGTQVKSRDGTKWLPAFPDLAGLATNPDTGQPYEVGDFVYRNDIFSNGVVYGDYLDGSSYLPASEDLDRFHTFYVGVNLALVGDVDVDLAAEYLARERPMHTKLLPAGIFARHEDLVLEDDVLFEYDFPFFDNVALGLPTALKLDRDDVNGAYLSLSGTMRRRTPLGDETQIENPIWEGTIEIVQGADHAVIDGTREAGVMVGDSLVFVVPAVSDTPSYEYTVTGVYRNGDTEARVYLEPSLREATGSYSAVVVRPALLCKSKMGPSRAAPTIPITGQAGAFRVTVGGGVPASWLEVALLRPRDRLTYGTRTHEILHVVRETGELVINPTLGEDLDGQAVTLERAGRRDTPIRLDLLEDIPEDVLELELTPDEGKAVYHLPSGALTTLVTATNVQDFGELGVRPLDFVRLVEGPDALVDVGYGPGYFPIRRVLYGTALELCVPLSGSTPEDGYSYSLIRRISARAAS